MESIFTIYYEHSHATEFDSKSNFDESSTACWRISDTWVERKIQEESSRDWGVGVIFSARSQSPQTLRAWNRLNHDQNEEQGKHATSAFERWIKKH